MRTSDTNRILESIRLLPVGNNPGTSHNHLFWIGALVLVCICWKFVFGLLAIYAGLGLAIAALAGLLYTFERAVNSSAVRSGLDLLGKFVFLAVAAAILRFAGLGPMMIFFCLWFSVRSVNRKTWLDL